MAAFLVASLLSGGIRQFHKTDAPDLLSTIRSITTACSWKFEVISIFLSFQCLPPLDK